MTWQPAEVVVEPWGRLQLVIDGEDVTYYRGIPAQIKSWTTIEPFGDGVLEVAFPQVAPFEALPPWLGNFVNVDLYRIDPAGNQISPPLWQGFYADEGDSHSDTGSELTLQCVGALFQADFYKKQPPIEETWAEDIGPRIKKELSADIDTGRPAMRLLPVDELWTGIIFTTAGAWNSLLTGYIQDMLAVATSNPFPMPGEVIVGMTLNPAGDGYFLTGSYGSVIAFGDARYAGSMLGTRLNRAPSRIAHRPQGGYWFAALDGGVFSFGGAPFFGSLGDEGNLYPVVAIESMPDGNGYRLADNIGGVFTFGSATFHGSVPALPANVPVTDMGQTISGEGYWLLSRQGHVYAYGDAAYHGGAEGTGKEFRAMAVDPTGNGYWLLSIDGYVYYYGTPYKHYGDFGIEPENTNMIDIVATHSGEGYYLVGEDGGIFTYGDAPFLGSAVLGGWGGIATQWTVTHVNRTPIVKVKNVWDVDWHVSTGSPGITHELHRDLTMAPNVYYGEGTNPELGQWRNSKYPNVRPYAPPVFSGTILKRGNTSTDAHLWKQAMYDSGWTTIQLGKPYGRLDEDVARLFQFHAGLKITGEVNAQTWAATFFNMSSNDPDRGFFLPLAVDQRTEPWLYDAFGSKLGPNPEFDPTLMRLENYTNFGSNVTKEEGLTTAAGLMQRDNPADYIGTITLKADPEEGSRFDIKAGDNIVMRYHRGTSRQFHISGVTINWTDQSVSLTVDQQARDLVTVAALHQRWQDLSDPARRASSQYRNSKQVDDQRSVWDTENGAGIIPRHAISGGVWNVIRMPAGSVGQVANARFTVDTPARFSVGIFDREITPAALLGVGSSPLDEKYWDGFDAIPGHPEGLVVAWGGHEQAFGYYPGRESDGDALTGVGVDNASWYFRSRHAPWLWVALWVQGPGLNHIQGKLTFGVL